jgi:hypothetical protein
MTASRKERRLSISIETAWSNQAIIKKVKRRRTLVLSDRPHQILSTRKSWEILSLLLERFRAGKGRGSRVALEMSGELRVGFVVSVGLLIP